MINNEGSFIKNLITKATEHSKRLTIVDTVIYFVLMIILIVIMVVRTDISYDCVEAMKYVTTSFVALRGAYAAKGAVENYQKIKNSFTENNSQNNWSENG